MIQMENQVGKCTVTALGIMEVGTGCSGGTEGSSGRCHGIAGPGG